MVDIETNTIERHKIFASLKSISVCDNCGKEQNMVHDSRIIGGIRRRRKICSACGFRSTTYEIRKEDLEEMVTKDGGGDVYA